MALNKYTMNPPLLYILSRCYFPIEFNEAHQVYNLGRFEVYIRKGRLIHIKYVSICYPKDDATNNVFVI